ncbi:MAG TPA: endonuclease/exonuclease/phosphatase family protein [Blastocatellia bacterium]|nr:endonuclease/exonuclease/phosphatase family protein [Blastocatellia bacterium]
MRLRVVTYNVHRCRGMDRRIRPRRIVEVLGEINADVIALQEVLSIPDGRPEDDQARFIAEQLKLLHTVGGTRRLRGGIYGNVILSRWPILATHNYDISVRGREQRGCLRADVEVAGSRLMHVFNVHLGTAYLERRHQGRRLIDEAILNHQELAGPRLMLGDFNEWTRGLASKLLASHLVSADVRLHLPRSRTYPGVLPLLHLDHIYYEDSLQLEAMTLFRSRLSLLASDHLPLVADFQLPTV